MQPFSGNQRRDLLTSLMNMSLVLRLPREIHLCRSSANVSRQQWFLEGWRIPCACYTCGALYILISTCASRHNGVHFFNISTSKSVPRLMRFVHFDFETCFAPQWRALFEHRNFQKCSEHGVILTSKPASRHSGVHFFHITTATGAPDVRCFSLFHFQMCFAPQRRAIFHLSSGQMAPHPPL